MTLQKPSKQKNISLHILKFAQLLEKHCLDMTEYKKCKTWLNETATLLNYFICKLAFNSN